MIRDEPEHPHEQEVRAYERGIRADEDEASIPRWQVAILIPLVLLPRKYVFPLALGLFASSLTLAVTFYLTPAIASGTPSLLAVAIVTGLIAAYYGAAWYDERRPD